MKISEEGLGRSELKGKFSLVQPESHLPKIVKVGDLEFPPRKVWMKTFGCQMNYHDTERILYNLKDLNFSHTSDIEDADLVLFNTCAVRDLANNKFYSKLGEIKHAKKKKKDLVVGVGGCVAQTEGKELISKFQHLDFAFGTDVIDQINDMVYRTYAGDNKFLLILGTEVRTFLLRQKLIMEHLKPLLILLKDAINIVPIVLSPIREEKSVLEKLWKLLRILEG